MSNGYELRTITSRMTRTAPMAHRRTFEISANLNDVVEKTLNRACDRELSTGSAIAPFRIDIPVAQQKNRHSRCSRPMKPLTPISTPSSIDAMRSATPGHLEPAAVMAAAEGDPAPRNAFCCAFTRRRANT